MRLTFTGTNAVLSSPRVLDRSLPFEVDKSHITTLDPCCTNRSTAALPKPDAPPVTKVTPP